MNFVKICLAVVACVMLSVPESARALPVGKPVRCFNQFTVQPTDESFLTCLNIAGLPFFEGGQRVPEGHFLLVTDIILTPDAGLSTSGLMDVRVTVAAGENDRLYSLRLRSNAETVHQRFGISHLILGAGQRLELQNSSLSQFGAQLEITGLLVTELEMPIYFSGFELH